MCFELCSERYATPKTRNSLLMFLAMRLVPTVVLETHTSMIQHYATFTTIIDSKYSILGTLFSENIKNAKI